MTIWLVLATCASLKGTCAYSPPSPMPSREACFQYGRKLQLERKQPMNKFRCIQGEIK